MFDEEPEFVITIKKCLSVIPLFFICRHPPPNSIMFLTLSSPASLNPVIYCSSVKKKLKHLKSLRCCFFSVEIQDLQKKTNPSGQGKIIDLTFLIELKNFRHPLNFKIITASLL
jgi:hypothetical protein